MSHRGHNRQSYKRSCSICGRQVPFHTLKYIGQERWACTDDKAILTAEQLARHQARLPPLVVLPRRHAFIQGDVPTYLAAEARVFNSLVFSRSGAGGISTVSISQTGKITTSATLVGRTAWKALYLVGLLREAERPLRWEEMCRPDPVSAAALLRGPLYVPSNPFTTGQGLAGTYFRAQIGTGANNPGITLAGSYIYGSMQDAGILVYDPMFAANAGTVFLFMYEETGNVAWLNAAISAGHHLRNSQRRDLRVSDFTSTTAGGTTPLYVGGWNVLNVALTNNSAKFTLEYAYILVFLAKLRAAIGGAYLLGSPSSGAIQCTAPPQATLDTTIAEAREFYVNGKALQAGAPARGLLSTTPAAYYYSFLGAGSGGDTAGDGLFHLDGAPETSVTGKNFAMALRGLYEVEGYSATVASLFEYLMAFTSNPTYEPAAGASDWDRANTTLGEYDPELAIAQTLTVDNGAGVERSTNGSAVYDFAATALLAPLYVASGRSLRATKDLFAEGRRISPNDPLLVYASPTGVTGMGPLGISQDIITADAAIAGELFRWEPKGQIQNRGLA